MKKLTVLEEKVLEILRQLEYKCESLKADWKNKDKKLPVYASDLNFSALGKADDLYAVAQYLQKSGLDFSVIFDLINESPYSDEYISLENPNGELTEVAVIKGTTDSILKKIKELIQVLSPDSTIDQEFWITKDEKGNYFFDNEPLIFKNDDTQYQVIFDIVFTLRPRGGRIKYKEIINQCNLRGKKNITQTKILRALSGKEAILFKIIKNLKQKVTFGKNLFDPIRGKGEIEFNNRK